LLSAPLASVVAAIKPVGDFIKAYQPEVIQAQVEEPIQTNNEVSLMPLENYQDSVINEATEEAEESKDELAFNMEDLAD